MANGHGGYRAPENPAATSGPGALSRRTDGALAGQGETTPASIEAIEAAGGQAAQAMPVDTSGVIPMEEESLYPDVPVTDGAMFGPGDPDLSGVSEDLAMMRGHLKTLKFLASMPHASNATRQLVRHLEGQLNG